jgi:hypothetical protein
MTCLNDSHIQALADGEGSVDDQRHVAACPTCAATLRDRQALMAQIEAMAAPPVTIPAPLGDRVEARLAGVDRRHDGATRLRSSPGGFVAPRRATWLFGTLGVAAATVVAVIVVVPAIRRADTTVSAAEVLAKSATQLAAAPGRGVELLEYELTLEGVPKEILPDQKDGAYRIWQAIDHGVPGRFRFASFTPDGRLFSSIADDPPAGRRVAAFFADGQPYRFEVTLPAGARNLSLPEMQRLHMQASIAMMQASGNQLLDTIDGPHGKVYRIEVPRVTGPGTNPVWDLTEGRVSIDATDYSIVEFAVRGSFLKQEYAMSYKLLSHTIDASLPPDAFAVPRQAGEIVITGAGSAVPTQDVFLLSLRELTRLKQGR